MYTLAPSYYFMGKVNFRRLKENKYEKLKQLVVEAMRSMKKQEDFCELVTDLLTPSEIVMLGRRIQIAQWLLIGRSHDDVAEKLHAGLDTVYAVDRWLRERCNTYQQTFPSLYAEMVEAVQRERAMFAEPYSWRWIQNKYPMHCGLISLLLDDIEARKRLRE